MNLTSTACSHIADHTQAMSMSSLRAAQALRASARVLGGSLLSSEFGTNILQHKAPSSARFVSAVRAKGAVSPEADLHVQKAKAVELALKEINAKHGKGTVMHFGADQEVDDSPKIATGALTLDLALGGGYPAGRIVEIFGSESTGKSTLALHALASAQKRGGFVCLVDAENAFDKHYADRMGLRRDSTFVVSQPDTGEIGFSTVEKLILSEAFDIICIDSVAALVPRAELEGDVGTPQMGMQARLMSQGLRKITGICAKSKTTVIFLNQIRHKIQPFGNPETTTGGLALKFYASIRIRLSRVTKNGPGLDAAGNETGVRIKAQVVKNKCAPPFRGAEFDILWSCGISSSGCLLDVAEKVGVVVKRGSWYSYNGQNLAQGRDKMLAHLDSHPDFASQMEEETRIRIGTNAGGILDASKSMDEEDEDLDEATALGE